MKTAPNSIRTIAPVGHASRQPATSQCLHTSDENPHAGSCSLNFRPRRSVAQFPQTSRVSMSSARPPAYCRRNARSIRSHRPQAGSTPYTPPRRLCSRCRAWNPSEMQLCSCPPPQLLSPYFQCAFVLWRPSWFCIAHQCFSLHDAYIWLFGNSQQIIRDVTGHHAFIAKLIGQGNCVPNLAVHFQRPVAFRNQRPSLHNAPHCGDRQVLTVAHSDLSSQLRRDLREQLWLQFRQVRQVAAHGAAGVVFGQTICAQHVREAMIALRSIGIVGPFLFVCRRIGAVLRIEHISYRTFQRLVMRGQRSILQPAGYPDPAHAVRMHDERFIARNCFVALRPFRRPIIRSLCLGEVGLIVASPFFLVFIPPDQCFTLAPRFSIRTRRCPVVEDSPVTGPGESPSMSVSALRLALARPVFISRRHYAGVDPAAARS